MGSENYDFRTASSSSYVTAQLTVFLKELQPTLLKKLQKYADGKHNQVKVEIRGTGKVRVTLWIHLEEEGWTYRPEDFKEVAELMLGDGMEIGPHKMDPNIYVAGKDYEF